MKKVLFLIFVAVPFLSSCTDKTKPNVELIQDMMESPAMKPQEYDPDTVNHISSRVPPENTVPVGFKPYLYGNDAEKAARENKNPISGDQSPEVLMTGQKYYETNCMVCHGSAGEGSAKSTVSEFMALKPPSLLSPKILGWNDAQIYHVITMGQGVMGPYASHVPQASRWQVVNYIRHLQKKAK